MASHSLTKKSGDFSHLLGLFFFSPFGRDTISNILIFIQCRIFIVPLMLCSSNWIDLNLSVAFSATIAMVRRMRSATCFWMAMPNMVASRFFTQFQFLRISGRHRNFSITKSRRTLDQQISMLHFWLCRHRRTEKQKWRGNDSLLFSFSVTRSIFSHVPHRKRKQEKIGHRISLTSIDFNVRSISMFFLMEPSNKKDAIKAAEWQPTARISPAKLLLLCKGPILTIVRRNFMQQKMNAQSEASKWSKKYTELGVFKTTLNFIRFQKVFNVRAVYFCPPVHLS